MSNFIIKHVGKRGDYWSIWFILSVDCEQYRTKKKKKTPQIFQTH